MIGRSGGSHERTKGVTGWWTGSTVSRKIARRHRWSADIQIRSVSLWKWNAAHSLPEEDATRTTLSLALHRSVHHYSKLGKVRFKIALHRFSDERTPFAYFSTVNFRNDRLHCEKARLKFFQFARPTIFRHSMVIKGSASIASKRRFGRAPYRDAGCPSFFRAVRKRSNESGLALRAYCRPRKRTIVSWHFRRARDLGRFNGSLIPRWSLFTDRCPSRPLSAACPSVSLARRISLSQW